MSDVNTPILTNLSTDQASSICRSSTYTRASHAELNTKFESLGIYLPNKEVLTSDIINGCKETISYPLERLTGIKSRRMAGENEFAIHLATHAIQECLHRSSYNSEDIELLICCNISRYDGPNFQFSFEPSTSIRLREKLNMHNVLCFDISNACAGMFTGINLADAFLKAGVVSNALIVSGEYLTHSTKTAQQEITDIYDDRMACLTLGDCGAAVILEQSQDPSIGFHDIDLYTLGNHSDCCIAKPTDSTAGGAIMFTDSVRIHDVAINRTVKDVENALKKTKWTNKDLQYLISHQTARAAIIDFTRQFNDYYKQQFFESDNVIINLENRGNTASTTHMLAIWDNINSGRVNSGDNILFSIQASGITLGSAPYTFDDFPERMREYNETGQKPKRHTSNSHYYSGVTRPQKLVRIESVGTIPDTSIITSGITAINLAKTAAENCLQKSIYPKSDINLLIHAGVHRDEFISEPALAALIAGDLDMNGDLSINDEHKTFAFDVINGALSFLNACHTAVMLLNSEKFSNAMILASEIENNNPQHGRPILGLEETGSAAILDISANGEEAGFLSFSFQYFTEHVDKYYSKVGQENGMSYLDIRKNPSINDYYIECIIKSVDSYLTEEGIRKDEINAVFPPQISKRFVDQLQDSLGFKDGAMTSIADNHDYFTSSTLYSMQSAMSSGQVIKGDLALIINVGTGIQVGCAIYRF